MAKPVKGKTEIGKFARWIFPIFTGLCAFTYFPHFSSLIFAVGCVLSLPLPQIKNFLSKKGVSGPIKVAVLAAVLFGGIMSTPSQPKEPDRQMPTATDQSVMQPSASGAPVLPDVSDPQTPPVAQTPDPANDPEPDTSTPQIGPATPEPAPDPTPAPVPNQKPYPAPDPDPAPTQAQDPKPALAPTRNTNADGKDRRENWTSGYYLGSDKSDKYHDYECRAAKTILPENEVWFASEEEAQAAGYSRCGICW